MTLAVQDDLYNACLEEARAIGQLRGTPHGFVEWMAKALSEGQQILFAPGSPESGLDLEQFDSEIGPLLLIHVGTELRKATLESKVAKMGGSKGTWISAGRGKNKQSAYVTKIVHHAKNAAPAVQSGAHMRKPSGFAGERDAIARQLSEKAANAQPARLVTQSDNERVKNATKRLHQHASSYAAPFATMKEIEERSAGMKPLKVNPKTGEPYPMPGPYDRWVTLHPWGGGEGMPGQPVLITQVPGHKGRFMTVREPGQGRQRFREIRTITTEDMAKESVAKRKLDKQKKYEQWLQGRSREAAQFAASHPQSKFATLRTAVEKRLGMRGHQTYTACTHPRCKEDEQRLKHPIVHLYNPEVARAVVQKRYQGQKISEELANYVMMMRLEKENNRLDSDLRRRRKIREGYGTVPLGQPMSNEDIAEGEAEKHLRIFAGLQNSLAIAERRSKATKKEIDMATNPQEKKLAEGAYAEAVRGLLRIEEEMTEHYQGAHDAADLAKEFPVPRPELKGEALPKADLEELSQLPANLEEFASRRQYYRDGIKKKADEYASMIPALEKQLKDIQSGKATGAPPGKTSVKENVALPDEPGAFGPTGQTMASVTAVPVTAALKARQMEADTKRQIAVAKVMVDNFGRAIQTLDSDSVRPEIQRKVVNYALNQEQQDAQKVLATARITAAQAKAKEEGRDKRAKPIEVPQGSTEGLPEDMLAEDAKLSDQFAQAQNKYSREKSTAAADSVVTSMSPLYGDAVTTQAAADLEKQYKRDLQDKETARLIHQAFDPWEAANILGEDRNNLERKIIAGRHVEGMYSAFHTMSVGTAMEGLVDPSVVSVLGQEGTARAVAAWFKQNSPDQIDTVRDRIQKWVDSESDRHVSDVLETADTLLDEARELQTAIKRREGNSVHMAEIHGMNKEMEQRLRQHIGLLAHALGQENAVNSLLGALKEKGGRNVEIVLHNIKSTDQITERMSALRLSRGVKEGEGDYTTRKAGEQWVADINYDSLAKTIHKTHEQIFTPEQIQRAEDIKNGYTIKNGEPVFLDDPQYLPPLFSERQVGHLYGSEKAEAKRELEGVDAKSLKEKMQRAIGKLAMFGMGHRDIAEYMSRAATANELLPGNKHLHESYRKMLAQLLPSDKERTVRERVREYARRVAGGDQATLDSQELDPLFAQRNLRNSFMQAPHHILAYKSLDAMDGAEKDRLKHFWADMVAGSDYGGRDEDTEGKAAWRFFMKKVGGENAALEIAQELLRDEHLGKLVKHMTASGTRMALGDKAIKNAQHLGELAYKGPLAGLTKRRSLGDRAEAQLRQLANGNEFRPGIAANFRANQQPRELKTGRVRMYGDFVRQQRAIRLFGEMKRLAVLTEPSSGKTVIGAGGFTEARARHIAEAKAKGEKPTPFRSIWSVPASLIANGQTEGELNSFLAPNALRFHARPLDGDERHAQRVSLMKDNGLDIYVTSPENLREDILRILRDFKEVGGSTRHIEGRNKLLDPQTRSSLLAELDAADPEARRNSIVAALKHAGIAFNHIFVDEGHRLANRPGKKESEMSTTISALADGTPHFMLGTASPAENDFGEVLDLGRKIRPDLFAERARKDPNLRTPQEHIVRAYKQLASRATLKEVERAEQADIDVGLAQAFRREIAPLVFNVPKSGLNEIHSDFEEEPVTLTKEQQRRLDIANGHASTARMYYSNPVAATRSMRFLAPQRFEGVDESDAVRSREVTEKLLDHVETLRRNAVDAALHEGTHTENAKLKRLVELTKHDARMRSPKTGRPASGLVFVNRIKSAEDVAEGLKQNGVEAYAITSQTNPADLKKWEERYRATQGTAEQVVLVLTPTGAVGKEYQQGAWTVHFDLPHSQYQLEQREGRIKRAGQQHGQIHNVRLYARNNDGTKHELEQARERVIRSKAPLMGLFDHEKVGRDDTDLAHLLSLQELARPKEQVQEAMAAP